MVLVLSSALRGYSQEWMARCQYNMTWCCICVLCISVDSILLTQALWPLMKQAATVMMTERLLKAT